MAWRLHGYRDRQLLSKLKQLVTRDIPPGVSVDPDDGRGAAGMLDAATWASCHENERVTRPDVMLQAILRGGCDPSLRIEVWPYLLGVYPYGCTPADRVAFVRAAQQEYEHALAMSMALADGGEDPYADTDLAWLRQVCHIS